MTNKSIGRMSQLTLFLRRGKSIEVRKLCWLSYAISIRKINVSSSTPNYFMSRHMSINVLPVKPVNNFHGNEAEEKCCRNVVLNYGSDNSLIVAIEKISQFSCQQEKSSLAPRSRSQVSLFEKIEIIFYVILRKHRINNFPMVFNLFHFRSLSTYVYSASLHFICDLFLRFISFHTNSELFHFADIAWETLVGTFSCLPTRSTEQRSRSWVPRKTPTWWGLRSAALLKGKSSQMSLHQHQKSLFTSRVTIFRIQVNLCMERFVEITLVFRIIPRVVRIAKVNRFILQFWVVTEAQSIVLSEMKY